jgi:metallophosphoesterase (TIGR00282 family)
VIVLFVGDVVGPEATAYVASRLPELRREHGVDLAVVNAENCAPSGMGMTVELVELLFEGGADVVTGGNHSWDGPEAAEALEHPRVLRPYNVSEDLPGKGIISTEASGETITILNLAGAAAFGATDDAPVKALPVYPAWRNIQPRGTVLVDFHGDHVIEKQIFAYAVDGEATAVLGTHTHEPTLPLHILPGGTALVTDVGMTGPLGGVQGFAHGSFVAGLKQEGDPFALPLPGPVAGPIALGAVILEMEEGKTRSIERLD